MPHILIATDFSDNAMHAAEYAVHQFGKRGNTYTLLHAYIDMTTADPMMSFTVPELTQAVKDGLDVFTERFVRRTGADGVRKEVRYGTLAAVVKDMARHEGVGIVVMGNAGRTGVQFFGSNTVSVIKMNRITVLAVPLAARLEPVNRILLADDYEDILPRHLETLRLIATLDRAEVVVAHVDMELAGGGATWTDRMYGLALRGIPHSFEVVHDKDVVDGLDRLARSKHVDMIAVLHRHIGMIGRLFHPSTAGQLVRRADLPLLVLQDAD